MSAIAVIRRWAALGVAGALLLSACSAHRESGPTPPQPPTGLRAVLINGGGSPESNYRSHMEHLTSFLDVLTLAGVPAENVAVFSSDGSDPSADLATRGGTTEAGFWLIPWALAPSLRPPIEYVDSALPGVVLHPARKDALREWFQAAAIELQPDDTLLIYVTDHGEYNAADLANNDIVLWGENLSVEELREMLAPIDPRVRVVTVMSQCFAGSFAHLSDPRPDGTTENVCGYFAASADRPAYGCYPENRGKASIGHAFHFINGLRTFGSLPQAHLRTLEVDDTPDVPHTTLDFYLESVVSEAADRQGVDLDVFADRLLREARGQDAPADEQLARRISDAFGMPLALTVTALDEQRRAAEEYARESNAYAARWRASFEALRRENFGQFLKQYPKWKPKLSKDALSKLDAAGRRSLSAEILADLIPFTKANQQRNQRLEDLRVKSSTARAAVYRGEVRLGVLLRLRTRLVREAGLYYVDTEGSPAERATVAALRSCENLALLSSPALASAAEAPPPAPYPPLADDAALLSRITPGWLGVYYTPLNEQQRKTLGVGRGAVTLGKIYAASPAEVSGLQVGDIVLGPPEAHFEEPHQLAEWTAERPIGMPQVVEVWRAGQVFPVTISPTAFPAEALLGPPPPTPEPRIEKGG